MNRKTRILLMDEGDELIDAIALVLASRGVNVHTAILNEEILRKCKNGKFDLLVIGSSRSRKNEDDLLNKLRKLKPDQRILAITDVLPYEVEKRTMQRDRVKYVTKRFFLERFLGMISEALKCDGQGV